jgi:hypothetical protein
MTTKAYAKQLAKTIQTYYEPVEDSEAFWGGVADAEIERTDKEARLRQTAPREREEAPPDGGGDT